jgi:hypothetical protein
MTPRPSRPAPAWLEDFQARVGAVIRAPLDRSTGTLRATTAAYDPLVDARDAHNATALDRLAVYNRQYWFRLFGVLQSAFPLSARLLGHWTFNDYAARFLRAHPPRSWDIDHAPDGFESWLAEAVEHSGAAIDRSSVVVAREALIEAANFDAAWREVFRAPETVPYRPSEQDAARLADARLLPLPAMLLVEEHWPLFELRRSALDDAGETAVALPPRLAHGRWSALVRHPGGIARVPLETREAELLVLLRSHSVREALGRLEDACTPEERTELPGLARAWLARSVQLDFWGGIAFDEE